jgi:hypothetical protein
MVEKYGITAMKIRFFIALLIAAFLSISCSISSEQKDNTLTATPHISIPPTPYINIAPRNISSPTITPVPPPTRMPIPTLSIAQQVDLAYLLQSGNCILPCYLSIEPGKTTLEEAENAIFNLGGIVRTKYDNLYPTIPEKTPLKYTSYILLVDSSFSVYINILGEKYIVQQIEFDGFSNWKPLFYEMWKEYSPESIFKNYGQPDQILIRVGVKNYNVRSYGIKVVYINLGMVIEWSGLYNLEKFPDYICPIFSKESINNINIKLADNQYTPEIINAGIQDDWGSTAETLGVTEKEFFESILANPEICFKRVDHATP